MIFPRRFLVPAVVLVAAVATTTHAAIAPKNAPFVRNVVRSNRLAMASPPEATTFAPRTVNSSSAMSSALAVRGGGPVDPATYVKIVQGFFGLYGLGLLLGPAVIWAQHFHGGCSGPMKFFMRGSSLGFLSITYFLGTLAEGEAVKAALATIAACGILYPWAVKFDYFGDNLQQKYPIHWIPELATLALTVAGFLAL